MDDKSVETEGIEENPEGAVWEIMTIFNDADVLDGIAAHLRKHHQVTGSSMKPMRNSHTHRGVEVTEDQWALTIDVPLTMPPEEILAIRHYMEQELGKYWDVPVTDLRKANKNEDYRLSLEKKESENMKLRRYKRRVRRSINAILASIGLASAIGVPAYVVDAQNQESNERARKQDRRKEREKIYAQIDALSRKIETMASEANKKVNTGKNLTVESGENSYYVKEIEEMRDEVRKLEFALRKLKDEE
jgi:hypothetical protein